jgi:hypothetical protein
MNSDSYVLVLSGKHRKFSITFVFRSFAEKNNFGGHKFNRSKSILELGFSK